jgi:pimeloyl-ACP methyl ester carboxylesterase
MIDHAPLAEPRSLYRSAAGYAAMMAWYEAALARLPVAYEPFWLPTRFGATHGIAVGPAAAPPVVLLHGTAGNALLWRPQLIDLAGDFRVYAIDRIGSAGKSAPARPAYGGPDYAHWLIDVLDGLHLASASLVGVSGGGWLILKLATLAPDRIASAVLLSTAGLVPLRFPYRLYRHAAVRAATALAADRLWRRPEQAGQVFRRASPSGVPVDEATVEWLYLAVKHFKAHAPEEPLPPADQATLVAPTLVLMGERDAFFDPRRVIAQARRTLPNLRAAEIVPDAGHALTDDQPALVNARLRRFLTTLR